MGDLNTPAKRNAFIDYLWDMNKNQILSRDDLLQRKKEQYEQVDKKVENWRDEIKTDNQAEVDKMDNFLKILELKDNNGKRLDKKK